MKHLVTEFVRSTADIWAISVTSHVPEPVLRCGSFDADKKPSLNLKTTTAATSVLPSAQLWRVQVLNEARRSPWFTKWKMAPAPANSCAHIYDVMVPTACTSARPVIDDPTEGLTFIGFGTQSSRLKLRQVNRTD